MLHIDGGIVLPIPRRARGFTKPEDMTDYRWKSGKRDRWERAYTHCLHSLPLYFDLPLHTVVPRLSKKMMEASEPFLVALRFMGEMEKAGYVKLKRGYNERIVLPTDKFLKLTLDCARAPSSAISYPIVTGLGKLPEAPIRGGIASPHNRFVSSVTMDMAEEEFEINTFMLEVIKAVPPKFDKTSSAYMYKRAVASADVMAGLSFKFPYFLDSRGRMYTDTTCGFNPQGADYEKALVIPTYSEKLSPDGFKSLLEAAKGYSEQNWSVRDMARHADYPLETQDEWLSADKPYCYLSCAKLIQMHLDSPEQPLPAFIPLDGRCSGLQHWSAVVRSDAITAHLGMEEDEHKLDIYEKVAHDWKESLGPEQQHYATRKAAKVPVMTWGYNATMMTSMEHMKKLFGAKTKWNNDLGQYVTVDEGLERGVCGTLGADLYRQLQNTLGPLQDAVEWVSDAAVSIASLNNPEIRWPTPDGFTCLQRKIKGKPLDLDVTLDDGSRFQLDILDFTVSTPNSGKHKSAIAPNVIHSLDATHLRMVARRLGELGLPMVFIHDSFATHCNYRDKLYDIIVETFIELYSREYLADLKEYWEATYDVKLNDPPKLGNWNPSKLKGLERFFL